MEGDGEKGNQPDAETQHKPNSASCQIRDQAMIVKIEGAEQDADREGKPPALCGHAPFVEKCCFAAAPCPVLSSGENRLPVSRPPAPLIIRPRFLRAKEPDPIPDPARDQF